MKKFREFYKGYCNWCDEGQEKKYGNFQLLLMLPTIIYFIYVAYQIGKYNGEKEERQLVEEAEAARKRSDLKEKTATLIKDNFHKRLYTSN